MTKIQLTENDKVNLEWRVRSIDYSRETGEEIIAKFAAKYGIPKKNIKLVPVFVNKKTENNEVSTSEIVSNIQDSKFQQELFKEYIRLNDIKDYDFDKIVSIDDEINASIDYDKYESHKKYTIKWIKWHNFMSYGTDNYFDFSQLRGLTLLTSEPANQGGKTTFGIDLLRFLLFGKVTSRENDWVLAKVFNKHLENETTCTVEGCVNIDDIDYIIRRTITRPSKSKRTDKSKVSQKVEYYRLVNDNYIELADESCEQGISTTDTNRIIKEAIGNEKDFDLMICVDSANLKSLISLKDADRGRLISRWIGLMPLEEKEKIAKDKYNHQILPKLLVGKYQVVDLETENENWKNENTRLSELNTTDKKSIDALEKELSELNTTRDTLLQSKQNIDENLTKVDVATLEQKLEDIKNDGQLKKNALDSNLTRYNEIKDTQFDIKTYQDKLQLKSNKETEVNIKLQKYKTLNDELIALEKGEFCPTCGAKLKGVDNTEKIKQKKNEIAILKDEGKKLRQVVKDLTEEVDKMKSASELYDEKNKLELKNANLNVELSNLRTQYLETKQLLNDIEKNKTAIANNNKIIVSLNLTDTNIETKKNEIKRLNDDINERTATIGSNNGNIEKNNKIIAQIEVEKKLVNNWQLYLNMIGRNGIGKIVLRNVLPIINGELRNLLNNVCDFEVEVSIDEHNDVAFSMIHDGVYSSLGSGSGFEQTVSSLALRSVLSQISTFSKPSFVVFDEILIGVAEENYDQVKRLYDKIVKNYQTILYITHNSAHKEWATQTVLVKKENNVSTIQSIK